ncbi:protein DpdF [Nocardia sp. 348MFTsu5.1]|uniref:protein DpdF n=1 Tax=Nocardia sp. 348MFTsu5.1 TaxID=1172185 RepID=UPI00039C3E1D
MIRPDLAQVTIDAWSTGASFEVKSRLASALSENGPGSTNGYADIAVLIRQCLRVDDETRLQSVTNPSDFVHAWLEVPFCSLFPETFDWSRYGLQSQPRGARRVRVVADRWAPPWLDVPTGVGVDDDPSSGRSCRIDESVRGDPFLDVIDASFAAYKSPGQRAAVRSAIVLPPGATLVVNLPTGAGKTLAMLAAVQITPPGMTSVIVVPTVALALDQERRYRAQNPDSPRTAYHGGLDEGTKKAIKEGLWSGTQTVIFTNPEAVVSSLARPLAEAARGGRLAMLGIDEAHVVGSWGDAFRPHFHSLAGLRSYLIRESQVAGQEPFKTILASATLNEDVLLLLRALFGEPGPFYQVAAPVLRPEPSFWQSTGLSIDEREDQLIETLRNVPRPAIVYTTLRQEQRPGTLTPRRAERILRDAGFRRMEIVDGGSSTAHRERVLHGLRADGDVQSTIDLVVATSAFGLGIDVPDIRSVIHICLPESIDRFYQEVGRGGRDGSASVSVLLATVEDVAVADSLSSPRYLTSERARQRWTSMLNASSNLGDGLLRLPLTATPEDVAVNSEYNERWNLFTLILLARTGAVEWDFSFSGRDDNGDLESDSGWITVRLVRGDHQTVEFWRDVVEPTRRAMGERSRLGLARLRKAINGTVCAGVLIAESFTIEDPPEYRAGCLASCGGCRWCRAHGKLRWTSPSPIPAAIAVDLPRRAPLDRLATNGIYGRRLAIHLDTTAYDSPRKMRNLLNGLVAASGARLIVAADHLADITRATVAKSPALVNSVMVDSMRDFDPIATTGVSTLVILAASDDAENWLDGLSRSPLTVVLGASTSPVGRSGLTLSAQDGCYSLADIDELQ